VTSRDHSSPRSVLEVFSGLRVVGLYLIQCDVMATEVLRCIRERAYRTGIISETIVDQVMTELVKRAFSNGLKIPTPSRG